MNTYQLSWVDLNEDNHVVEGSESAIRALYEIMRDLEWNSGDVVEVAIREK